jgi:hypothetical protein
MTFGEFSSKLFSCKNTTKKDKSYDNINTTSNTNNNSENNDNNKTYYYMQHPFGGLTPKKLEIFGVKESLERGK